MLDRQVAEKSKAALLELLKPLGFEDPAPEYLELIHRSTGLVISCTEARADNVVEIIFAKAFALGSRDMAVKVARVTMS